MKLKLNTSTLNDTLFYLSKLLLKRPALEGSYKCIQVYVKDKLLYLYGFNGNEACEALYGEVTVEEDFSCFVQYAMFETIVTKASAEFIQLDFCETEIKIKENKSRYSLSYYDITLPYLFNDFNPAEITPVSTFNFNSFSKVASFLSPSLTSKSAGSNSYGVYYDGNLVTNSGDLVAVYPFGKKIKNPLYIHGDSFKILSSLSALSDEASIYMVDNRTIVCNKNVKYFLRLMSNPFVPYKSLMSVAAKYKYKITIEKEDILSVCKKLTALVASKNILDVATLIVTKDNLKIKIGTDKIRGEEDVTIQSEGVDDQEISFRVRLLKLRACLSHIYNAEAMITFSDEHPQYILYDGGAVYIISRPMIGGKYAITRSSQQDQQGLQNNEDNNVGQGEGVQT